MTESTVSVLPRTPGTIRKTRAQWALSEILMALLKDSLSRIKPSATMAVTDKARAL
jgi:hypothetical protein